MPGQSRSAFAIETEYNGVRFRSRAEARWAVFFDTAGIRWEYEPEAYTNGSKRYLPDFWLPDLGWFVEVKSPIGYDADKVRIVVDATGKPLLVVHSDPAAPWASVTEYTPKGAVTCPTCPIATEGPDASNTPYWFCQCPECGKIGIAFDGRAERIECGCTLPDKTYTGHSPTLHKAYSAAKAYRFWNPK